MKILHQQDIRWILRSVSVTFIWYLWIKHVGDSLHGPVQQESSHQEAEEHHVGEDRGEVHHLRSHNNMSKEVE